MAELQVLLMAGAGLNREAAVRDPTRAIDGTSSEGSRFVSEIEPVPSGNIDISAAAVRKNRVGFKSLSGGESFNVVPTRGARIGPARRTSIAVSRDRRSGCSSRNAEVPRSPRCTIYKPGRSGSQMPAVPEKPWMRTSGSAAIPGPYS